MNVRAFEWEYCDGEVGKIVLVRSKADAVHAGSEMFVAVHFAPEQKSVPANPGHQTPDVT